MHEGSLHEGSHEVLHEGSHEVLHVVLMNLMKPDMIARFACINKTYKEYYEETLKYLQELYEKKRIHEVYKNKMNYTRPNCFKPNKCDICSIKTSMFDVFANACRCESCQSETISHSEARTKYKLSDQDLECLDCFHTYHFKHYTNIKLYLKRDVLGFCLIKHGTFQISKRVYTGALKSKRQTQLDELITKFVTDKNGESFIRTMRQCTEFIKNGRGGIRKLKPIIALWPEFSELQVENHYFMDYVINKDRCIRLIHEARERQIRYDSRRKLLAGMLAEYDLEIRSDSVLCREFIHGIRNDLIYIVTTMREMDFLYMKTKYQSILKEILNREYEQAKRSIRDSYGYISDPEEYWDILNEMVDKNEISEKAKQKAYKAYGKKPSFALFEKSHSAF